MQPHERPGTRGELGLLRNWHRWRSSSSLVCFSLSSDDHEKWENSIHQSHDSYRIRPVTSPPHKGPFPIDSKHKVRLRKIFYVRLCPDGPGVMYWTPFCYCFLLMEISIGIKLLELPCDALFCCTTIKLNMMWSCGYANRNAIFSQLIQQPELLSPRTMEVNILSVKLFSFCCADVDNTGI